MFNLELALQEQKIAAMAFDAALDQSVALGELVSHAQVAAAHKGIGADTRIARETLARNARLGLLQFESLVVAPARERHHKAVIMAELALRESQSTSGK